jgi:hypothetical protein
MDWIDVRVAKEWGPQTASLAAGSQQDSGLLFYSPQTPLALFD